MAWPRPSGGCFRCCDADGNDCTDGQPTVVLVGWRDDYAAAIVQLGAPAPLRAELEETFEYYSVVRNLSATVQAAHESGFMLEHSAVEGDTG